MSTPTTIVEMSVGMRKEGPAGGTINPGDLVQMNSSGSYVVHPTATAKAAPTFAIENEIFGVGVFTSGSISAYATGDRVLTETLVPGAQVHATVAASAAAIVKNDPLESAGNGTLRKASAETGGGIIARALEDVDNSSGSTKVHIKAVIV